MLGLCLAGVKQVGGSLSTGIPAAALLTSALPCCSRVRAVDATSTCLLDLRTLVPVCSCSPDLRQWKLSSTTLVCPQPPKRREAASAPSAKTSSFVLLGSNSLVAHSCTRVVWKGEARKALFQKGLWLAWPWSFSQAAQSFCRVARKVWRISGSGLRRRAKEPGQEVVPEHQGVGGFEGPGSGLVEGGGKANLRQGSLGVLEGAGNCPKVLDPLPCGSGQMPGASGLSAPEGSSGLGVPVKERLGQGQDEAGELLEALSGQDLACQEQCVLGLGPQVFHLTVLPLHSLLGLDCWGCSGRAGCAGGGLRLGLDLVGGGGWCIWWLCGEDGQVGLGGVLAYLDAQTHDGQEAEVPCAVMAGGSKVPAEPPPERYPWPLALEKGAGQEFFKERLLVLRCAHRLNPPVGTDSR
eukprot:11198666-Lingulodinium_polyedra.AAC.1